MHEFRPSRICPVSLKCCKSERVSSGSDSLIYAESRVVTSIVTPEPLCLRRPSSESVKLTMPSGSVDSLPDLGRRCLLPRENLVCSPLLELRFCLSKHF